MLPERDRREFEVGDSVWLYLARVKPGLSRKLAHLWHGPFRVIEKGEEYRYKLKVDGQTYRFYPWVHVSRLKARVIYPDRPDATLTDVDPDFDFDAALLPEDSWEPDETVGEYEVETILDVRWTKKTRTSRRSREYLVKWVGYDEPTWEPVSQLSCGALLHEFDQSSKAKSRFDAMQVADDTPDTA